MNENPWYMNIFNPEIVKKGMEIKEGKITMDEALSALKEEQNGLFNNIDKSEGKE